mmetsp:Transcript_42389/g.83285  ORF Transcript_42389/g.83285 Transcript_42389/m.83285 type:complete len:378 (-) Transcript_42389:218-1351(-)
MIRETDHGHAVHHGVLPHHPGLAVVRDEELDGLVEPPVAARAEAAVPEERATLVPRDGLLVVHAEQHRAAFEDPQGVRDAGDPLQHPPRVGPRVAVARRQQSEGRTVRARGGAHHALQLCLDGPQGQRVPLPVRNFYSEKLSLPRHHGVPVQTGIVEAVGIHLSPRHPAGVEHVLVGGGTQRPVLRRPPQPVRKLPRDHLAPELGRGAQHRGAPRGAGVHSRPKHRGREGAVVGQVNKVGHVDDHRIADRQVPLLVPPLLQPRTVGRPRRPRLQTALELRARRGREKVRGLPLEGGRLVVVRGQGEGARQQQPHAVRQRGGHGEARQPVLPDGRVEDPPDGAAEVFLLAVVAAALDHGGRPRGKGRRRNGGGGHGPE